MSSLYITSATRAAIVAAAPLLALQGKDQFDRVLILRGVADPEHPTPMEEREALNDRLAIARV